MSDGVCRFQLAAVFSFVFTGCTVIYNVLQEECNHKSFVSACFGVEGPIVSAISFCVLVVLVRGRVLRIAAIVSVVISLVSVGLFIISAEMMWGCLHPDTIVNDILSIVLKSINIKKGAPYSGAIYTQMISMALLSISSAITGCVRLYFYRLLQRNLIV